MSDKRLKVEFIECLSDQLKPKGFRYTKARNAFVNKTNFGEQWFTITFLKYRGQNGFEIIPGHHVRFRDVESFYHETSGFSQKDQKGTSTIGCSLENYIANGKDMFRMTIKSEKDVLEACKYYYAVFSNEILSFFSNFNTLESLGNLVNSEPEKELNVINPIFRGIKGVIIAHLLNDVNWENLVKIYSNQYESNYNGFYKSGYDKVVDNALKKKN